MCSVLLLPSFPVLVDEWASESAPGLDSLSPSSPHSSPPPGGIISRNGSTAAAPSGHIPSPPSPDTSSLFFDAEQDRRQTADSFAVYIPAHFKFLIVTDHAMLASGPTFFLYILYTVRILCAGTDILLGADSLLGSLQGIAHPMRCDRVENLTARLWKLFDISTSAD
ncbi:hypothetical protein DFH09DRAFT_1427584 [Mycena vulgaris]|nr:hypothetical protein DFH09DRAFT_1427584 [Mycena vulgaris]